MRSMTFVHIETVSELLDEIFRAPKVSGTHSLLKSKSDPPHFFI